MGDFFVVFCGGSETCVFAVRTGLGEASEKERVKGKEERSQSGERERKSEGGVRHSLLFGRG